MATIPDDIQKKIGDYADCRDRKDAVISDCIYGYSLSLTKIQELEKENERLKGLIMKAWFRTENPFDLAAIAQWAKFYEENNISNPSKQ